MGSWGIGVLENDHALDIMPYLEKLEWDTLCCITGILLNSRNEDEKLLGIAIVDTALNGKEDNIDNSWFDNLKTRFDDTVSHHVMLRFANEAFNGCTYLIETGAIQWTREMRNSRKDLYWKYRDRLEKYVK